MAYRRNMARNREWFRERRLDIESAKYVPCADCGIKYPFYVMQFDHVRGKKMFSIGGATAVARTVKVLYEEISKCEVVCANCHAVRTWSRNMESRKVGVLDALEKREVGQPA